MKIIENDGHSPQPREQEKQFSSPEDAERERMKTDEGGSEYFKNFGEADTDSYTDISSDSEPDEKTEIHAEITQYEDISSNSEPPAPEEGADETEEKKMNFFVSLWKNKRRRAKLGYAIVCVVMIVVGVAYGFVNAMLDKIEDEPTTTSADADADPAASKDVIYDEDDFELFSAIGSASSMNDYLKQWYNAGEPMQSRNVINVLLLGLDSKHGLEDGGRSDTMMLVSLNTKTKKIHMVSFFRDSWVYFKTTDGGEYYNKMNCAYFYGKSAKCTVETIENIFKIKIDHYVVTDFKSFQNLVDAVGGIRVDVQEYESKNMMREWQLECPVGENVLLNGKQAFYFARQRHSDADADVSRTRRQRQVITAFINSCKGASMSQLTDMLNKVFKYFRTDMTKTQILGYAARALANGWLNYDIEQIKITDPDIFRTPTIRIPSGLKQSIVVQDYPKVAQIVQNGIYGSTNVVLEDNRVIIFNLIPKL
ncbi:MAG: LCP family protein [Oscillospiraceae bacterium]|nr:LCP family protein [Oscillospiraceae bacterium]